MINHGTQQSTVKPLELELTETKVFVASDITPVDEPGTGEQPGFTGYVFELVEYDKDEYIKLQAEQNKQVNDLMNTVLGVGQVETVQSGLLVAEQMNRFMQLSVQAANFEDTVAMEIADLYQEWKQDTKYKADLILKYGVNENGETQLYRVIQEHTSQAQYTPDKVGSLYKKIGFTDDGTSVWTQPLGATDAYQTGDVVSHNGQIWVSTVDNNVWEPGVYGWEVQA